MSVQTEHQLSFEDLCISEREAGKYYVYLYRHPKRGVVYVGQTNNIDSRVISHAGHTAHSEQDRETMQASDIYFTLVRSREEALNLESNLIRKLKPQINDIQGTIYRNITLKAARKLAWYKYHAPERVKEPWEIDLRMNFVRKLFEAYHDYCIEQDISMTWM